MDNLPADISRKIYTMACNKRNDFIKKEITATIWCVLHFIQTSTVLYNEIPLFEGASTHLHITFFNVDKLQQPNGLITTRLGFWIGDDEFETTYGDYEGDADVCMYIANKHGKYKDVAAEAFWLCFPNGTVY
jgi:hypothetical protein